MGNVSYKDIGDCHWNSGEDEPPCGCIIRFPIIKLIHVSSTLACAQRECVGFGGAANRGTCPYDETAGDTPENNENTVPVPQPAGSCLVHRCRTVEFRNFDGAPNQTFTCCHNLKFQPEPEGYEYADGYPFSFNVLTGGYYAGQACEEDYCFSAPSPIACLPSTNLCCPIALVPQGQIGAGDCSRWVIERVLSHSEPLNCGTIFTVEGSGETINEDGEIVSAEPEELPLTGEAGDMIKFEGKYYTWLVEFVNGEEVGSWVETGEGASNGAACLEDGEACAGCGLDDCGGEWPASQEFPDYPEFKDVNQYLRFEYPSCIYDPEENPVWPFDCAYIDCGQFSNPYAYPTLLPGQGFADSAYNLSICNTAVSGGKFKQKMKFKIVHEVSPTCYLKVWVYKKYTFFPCKTEIINGGIEYVANPPCPAGQPWGGILQCPDRARRVFDFANPVVWYEEFLQYEHEASGTVSDPMGVTPRCADINWKETAGQLHMGFQECSKYIVSQEHEVLAPDVSGTTIELVFTYSCIKGYVPDPPEMRTYEWSIAPPGQSNKDGYPNQ